ALSRRLNRAVVSSSALPGRLKGSAASVAGTRPTCSCTSRPGPARFQACPAALPAACATRARRATKSFSALQTLAPRPPAFG
nr:hypothetical protein [Tanacetum cinerariifolium]